MFLACAVERIVPFSAPFDIQMQRQSYSRVIEARGERFLRQAQSEEEERELKARYDEHIVHLSKCCWDIVTWRRPRSTCICPRAISALPAVPWMR